MEPSIARLPRSVWEELAPPSDPMWARGVFSAMERGAIGPDAHAYIVVREGERITAVLPMSAFRGLRLDDVVGPRERQLLAPVRRLFPGLLRVPMLFCGNFLGSGHVLHAGPLSPRTSRLLVTAVMAYARRYRIGTVVFKDFADEELAPLRPALEREGFFTVPSLPDTELPLGYGSFEEYLAALQAKPRRNARSKIRKFHDFQPELRIEVLAEFTHLLPAMLGLYQQVMDRADQKLDVLDHSFLRALSEADDLDQRLVACFEGDRLVAYLHCLFRGSGAIGARIGLDYRIAHQARLYHNVHYAAIKEAINRGCRHIRFAQTAYEPKRELGCSLVRQSYAITHLRPVPRAVLRGLLPRALNSALADALSRKS
ncbi:GNAT family N-acetyltransferase [Streptantibioticus rubrisoli]|uniref:GNAT family N-acetyltransferase n=1 Tax=Streptantibioticus rubrisoli TaxID=1387313 RepID=A0ABT1PB45_9ACTN|nr:GNAT family N-acetyltransferase [Streptantibioticus rubrisoli]MCQ4042596.1 GNAT family N-acetyltransferase [Streptantibioticus rubrisoli]